MGRTFKSKQAQDEYWARWKQFQDTGSYPRAQKSLSGAQKASEAHKDVHPEEPAPAAAPHPTLFDLPTPPNRGTFDH